MKKLMIGSIVLGLAVVSQAVVIDSFDDASSLANYTYTVILDTGHDSTYSTDSWDVSGGALSLVTTAQDDIQQAALIYNGLSLGVGEEVQVTVTAHAGSQDVGLYVGGSTPQTDVGTDARDNFVNIYYRNDGQIFTAGHDGVSSTFGTIGWVTPSYSTSLVLFVERTTATTYTTGWYADGVQNVLTTRTANLNDADNIGLYTDVRAAGTLGTFDDLSVIPEPATIGLIGIFGAGMLVVRRRFMI